MEKHNVAVADFLIEKTHISKSAISMGDIVDDIGNSLPAPGNGRAKRARIDREGNLVTTGDLYAYNKLVQPPVRYNVSTNSGAKNSVYAFGAVGDNVADDTQAFQNAIAANSCIFVPPGRYRITDTLNITGRQMYGGCRRSTEINFENMTPGFIGFKMGVNANLSGMTFFANVDLADSTFALITDEFAPVASNQYINNIQTGGANFFARGLVLGSANGLDILVSNSRIHGNVVGLSFTKAPSYSQFINNNFGSRVGGTCVDCTNSNGAMILAGNVIAAVGSGGGNPAFGIVHVNSEVIVGNRFVNVDTPLSGTGTPLIVDRNRFRTSGAVGALTFAGVANFADDTAAAAGGVPIGGVYRTDSVLKVRVA